MGTLSNQTRQTLIGGWWGWRLGLVVGLADLVGRIFAPVLEWFELYLALLLPAFVFGLIFLVCTEVLVSVLRIFRRGLTPAQLSFFLVLLSFLCLVLLVGGVLVYMADQAETTRGGVWIEAVGALVVFAAGLSVLIGAYQRGALQGLLRGPLSLRVSAVLSSLSVALTVFIFTSAATDLYQIYSVPRHRPAVAASASSPNIILITLDTVRADHLPIYGYSKMTAPFLNELSQDSIVFENAVSTTSWTLPSHASIFTGLDIHRHGAHTEHPQLAPHFETLAELLRAHGYLTAGFVGGPYCKGRYGLAQGFMTYKDRLDYFEYHSLFDSFSIRRIIKHVLPSVWKGFFRADGERGADEINQDVRSWLKKNGSDPFFLFINYFDAHDPYDRGASYLAQFTNEVRPYDEVDRLLQRIYYGGPVRYEVNSAPPDLIEYLIALYDSEIAYLDSELRELFSVLDSLELREDTIVIITSDHGEEFFDHGGVLHRQTLYEEVLRVPLILHYPKRYGAERISRLVGSLDIFPTVLREAGIETPSDIDGVSLLAGSAELREHGSRVLRAELVGNKPLGGIDMRAVYRHGLKLIDVDEPAERVPDALFSLYADPRERDNLYDREREAREELTKILRSEKRPNASGGEQ